jgi:DNA-binding transcriptional MerR regulator
MNDRPSKTDLIVLPAIPAKRYFTIGEVSELCGVKPHVLRYWEQEFTQLKPVKRRGNRRYYQHHEVLLIRRIRELLYEQGFTISGARNKLDSRIGEMIAPADDSASLAVPTGPDGAGHGATEAVVPAAAQAALARAALDAAMVRNEIMAILALLKQPA